MPLSSRAFGLTSLRHLALVAVAAGAAAIVPAACSAGGDTNGQGFGGNGSGANASGTGSTTSDGVGGDGTLFDAGQGGGTGGGDTCAAESTTAQQLPLDMYVMFDQSGSMSDAVSGGGTKWSAATSALSAFVQQPNLDGISIGIQYFGVPPGGGQMCSPLCSVDADCGAFGPCFFGICLNCLAAGGDSCNAVDYATPNVEIAPLPGVAAAITASLGSHSPSTNTPTSAALQGAIDHAKAWAQANPNHAVIDVLVTDGDPTECDTNMSNIYAIAAAGAASQPPILTFVIGVGSSLTTLNGIAAAGGTTQAFLVDTNANANQQLIDALNEIRGAALSCSYLIPVPAEGTPDYNKVNVEYVPGDGGPKQVIPKVDDVTQCPASGDAWYYNDNVSPTQVILCQATCDKLQADTTGTVNILLGCETIVN